MLATLFVHSMSIESTRIIWLMIPLCVSIAVVYKTIRVKYLSGLPLQILWLIGYMVFGLAALGAGLWAIQEILR